MEYLENATRHFHEIKESLNCALKNTFFREHHFSVDITFEKIESCRLPNSLKIKSSNGNVPWNVYKYWIYKLITTPLNCCVTENCFSQDKAQ